jgi:hypothetical protein
MYKIRITDIEFKIGNISRVITSLNILPFRYELFGDGIKILCQLCDAENCVCLEEFIFISKESLKRWSDDSFIVDECLIRLGLSRYDEANQGKKSIKK